MDVGVVADETGANGSDVNGSGAADDYKTNKNIEILALYFQIIAET